ncbi:hypothetical protein Hanom_Chr09g00804881 [Helianthus anomalus]
MFSLSSCAEYVGGEGVTDGTKETLASMNFRTTKAHKISSRAFFLSLAFTSAILLQVFRIIRWMQN